MVTGSCRLGKCIYYAALVFQSGPAFQGKAQTPLSLSLPLPRLLLLCWPMAFCMGFIWNITHPLRCASSAAECGGYVPNWHLDCVRALWAGHMRSKMLYCIVFLVYYKRAAGVRGSLHVFIFGHCSGCFCRDVIGQPPGVKPTQANRIQHCTLRCGIGFAELDDSELKLTCQNIINIEMKSVMHRPTDI